MVSQRWAYIRIMTGTILGGVLGFYVMHRLEINYKERMKERLIKYENEMKRRGFQQQQQLEGEGEGEGEKKQQDTSELLPDS